MREKIIQHGKNRFLYLSAIAGAADKNDLAAQIENDKGLRVGAVKFGDSLEVGHVEHRKLRHMVDQLFRFGLDEHIAGKQVMPGRFGYHPDRQAILGIIPGQAVLHVQISPLQIGQKPSEQEFKLLR